MFQNRRGFAPVVVCQQCGWTPKCHNCDVSLVYHKNSGLLKCHYCGYCQPIPKLCPACGQNSIEVYGYGTERIAEELHREFSLNTESREWILTRPAIKDAYQGNNRGICKPPDRYSCRDSDGFKRTRFRESKGGGVINADTLLNFPDFRSSERAFNMLEQVAGRAGRRQDTGKVFIQTTKPDDNILRHVRAHDYKAYYNEELEERKRYSYPPFTRIINIYLKTQGCSGSRHGCRHSCQSLARYIRRQSARTRKNHS